MCLNLQEPQAWMLPCELHKRLYATPTTRLSDSRSAVVNFTRMCGLKQQQTERTC